MPKKIQPDFDLKEACRMADIHVDNHTDQLIVKSIFNLLSMSIIGRILFLIIAVVPGVMALLQSEDVLAQILCSILCFGVAIMMILSLLAQSTDYFKIVNNHFECRNSLVKVQFETTSNDKIKIRTRVEEGLTKYSRSEYRIVELFLVHDSKEHRIFSIQLDEKDSHIANQLSSEIARLLKEKISGAR